MGEVVVSFVVRSTRYIECQAIVGEEELFPDENTMNTRCLSEVYRDGDFTEIDSHLEWEVDFESVEVIE